MLPSKYSFAFLILMFSFVYLKGQKAETYEVDIRDEIYGIVGTSFNWPEGKKAALSLTFDDARSSHPTLGRALFQKIDARATFYVLPGNMKKNLEGWKQMVADGHEIGNHTVDHPCTGTFPKARPNALEYYTLADMRQELLTANQQIKELLGVTPISYAYTCANTTVGRGVNTQSYIPLIAELFQNGRDGYNETGNDPNFTDLALLQGVEMDRKDFKTDIKPILDYVVRNGMWLVLVGHEIAEDDAFQTTRTGFLEEVVAYAKRPENGIWLAPVGTIAGYVEEQRERQSRQLASSLTFCASFDEGFEADFANGDPRIFSAPAYDQRELAIPDLVPEEVELAENRGRIGHALEFKRNGKPVIFYPSKDNISYSESNWNGTISLWLNLDPETDLAPGYSDPIQITDAGALDAAFWADFSDKNPRSFRMGVFGDEKVWNPKKLRFDENPDFQNRLLPATDMPFRRGRWTHVVVSFSAINSDNSEASFYINGKLQGKRDIPESFSWELEKSKIILGLNYIGLMDEVALFDKALSAVEVNALYNMADGIQSLLEQKD